MNAATALLAAALLLGSAACSQHEYEHEGPVPQAPQNPRSAHKVVKGADRELSQEGAGAPGGPVHGDVVLPAELASRAKPGMVLYIIARPAGGETPTPVAAKKVQVDSFPLHFDLGDQDSTSGGPLPPSMEILLRLDEDGDLTTRGPNDLVGGPVSASPGGHVEIPLSLPPP